MLSVNASAKQLTILQNRRSARVSHPDYSVFVGAAEYFAMSVSVCLSVREDISRTACHIQSLPNLLSVCIAFGRGSVLL